MEILVYFGLLGLVIYGTYFIRRKTKLELHRYESN